MRLAAVYKVVALVLFVLSLSLIVPLTYSLFTDDGNYRDFLLPLTAVFLFFLPSLKFRFTELNLKEAVASVVLIWFLFPAVVSSVYVLGAHVSDPVDAYFEAVSGFTTTGATILPNIEGIPPSVLLWRSLTQWLGGLGFIVFSFSVLPFLRLSYRLVKFESSVIVEERISPRMGEVARVVLLTYLGITFVGILLLKAVGLPWFEAVNHTFTAVSTGGFSTKNLSVAAFNSFPVELALELLMFLGSLNLLVYYRAYERRNPLYPLKYFETKLLLLVIAAGSVAEALILLSEGVYSSPTDAFRYGLFQVVSAATTTGFANADFNLWTPSAQTLLLLLTLVGGSGGSTAGGIKQFRFNLLIKVLTGELKKTLHPRLVVRYDLGGKTAEISLIQGVLAFVFVYTATAVIFGFLVTLGGNDLVTSFSASVACLTSFGPGLGKVGPMDNYAFLSDADKLLLSAEMIMGRLEVLPVVALLYAFLFDRD